VSQNKRRKGIRLFENTVLRRIFGNKGEAVIGVTKMIHNGKVNTLFSSTDIIRMIRSRRIGFAGCIFSWGGNCIHNVGRGTTGKGS
jgi:hypothetical protein